MDSYTFWNRRQIVDISLLGRSFLVTLGHGTFNTNERSRALPVKLVRDERPALRLAMHVISALICVLDDHTTAAETPLTSSGITSHKLDQTDVDNPQRPKRGFSPVDKHSHL